MVSKKAKKLTAVKKATKSAGRSVAKPKAARTKTPSIPAALPETEAQREARLWPPLQKNAEASVKFWNSFLGLRSDNDGLTTAQIQRIVDLVRAVCWVESKHGTYEGETQHGDVDVMQCADTRNPWWVELIAPAAERDRFIGGPAAGNLPARPNWWADELPAAAAADATFNKAAAISTLTKPKLGSQGANFKPVHSLYWGVPYLIHRMNSGVGVKKTFQCSDLARKRLLDGAVAYNGKGDAAYGTKIENAMKLFGGARALKSQRQAAAKKKARQPAEVHGADLQTINAQWKGITVAAEPPIDNDTAKLDPIFLQKLNAALATLSAQGTPFKFVEGFRTRDRQQWLYGSGRPKVSPYGRPGAILTNADGVKNLSKHQGDGVAGSGKAADCYPIKGAHVYIPPASDPVWEIYASTVKAQGLIAGHDWPKLKDSPHCELS